MWCGMMLGFQGLKRHQSEERKKKRVNRKIQKTVKSEVTYSKLNSDLGSVYV